MPPVRLYAFSVGHVLNDMTAACWFSYLLIMLTQVRLAPRGACVGWSAHFVCAQVRGLDQSMAGVVMFCGQVCLVRLVCPCRCLCARPLLQVFLSVSFRFR